MKRFSVITSAVVMALANPPCAGSAAAQQAIEAARNIVVSLEPGRPQWPIAREPAGQWGIVGEAVARNTGTHPVAVRSISFTVSTWDGRLLLRQVFDTPSAIADVLLIAPAGASGAPNWKPAGTTVLEPGDTGVAFFVALSVPEFVPAHARVTMRFDAAPARTFVVPLKAFAPQQRMSWPLRLDGKLWLAFNTAGTVHHWVSGTVLTERAVFSSQRFALDLVQIDANGQLHPPSANAKEDYYAWGEEVLSVARGRVVAVMSDQRDLEIGEIPSPFAHPGGNFVVIQHGPRLFSVYGHMQRASAVVNVGDWVEQGQFIGRVGNSGDSTQPHLHVHFTDAWQSSSNPMASFTLSQGVPAVFWGAQVYRDGNFFELNGSSPLDLDVVVSPDTAR